VIDRDEAEWMARQALASYLDNRCRPWWLRARRRVAFALRDVGLVTVGYLLDYDRDRYTRRPDRAAR
jgi:hypothetical protein